MHTPAPSAVHRLQACQACDLVQALPCLQPGEGARCVRCGHVLVRQRADSLANPLALTLTALVLFVIANTHPLLRLELGGNLSESTLTGAALALWREDMVPVALLVLTTSVLVPALEILTLLGLLWTGHAWRRPVSSLLPSLLARLRPWSMMSVFLLGILVSLVKLASLANVVIGPALWALGLFIVVMAAANASFDPHLLWPSDGRTA